MKKLKMLMPILGTSTIIGAMVPITSCSQSYVVTLYTEVGSFADGSNVLKIHTDGGKKLNELKEYLEPSLPSYQFAGWTDANGKAFAADTKIDGDTVLIANFKEGEKTTPKDFATDSWPTVVDVCQQGYLAFAKAYCGYSGTAEDEAIDKINNEFTVSKSNIRNIYLGYTDDDVVTSVRLIGAACEKAGETSVISFTFEFTEVIDLTMFGDYTSNQSNIWWMSLLREYLNNNDLGPIFNAIPKTVRDAMISVDKTTIITDSYGEETDESPKVTTDFLFPLSRCEMNDFNGKADDWDANESTYNAPYPYYAQFEPTTEWEQVPARIKNYVATGSPINYWTRSPYLGDYNGPDLEKAEWEDHYGKDAVPGVVYDGGIHPQYTSWASIGVAPAFVIGEVLE